MSPTLLILFTILVAIIFFALFAITQRKLFLFISLGIGVVVLFIVIYIGMNLGSSFQPKDPGVPDVFGESEQ